MTTDGTDQSFVFGAARYERGGHYGPVCHPILDIGYVAKGNVQVVVDGVRSQCSAGYVNFIYARHELEVIYPAGMIHDVMWCQTDVIPELALAGLTQGTLPISLEPSDLLLALLTQGNALGDGADAATARVRDCLGQAVINEYLRMSVSQDREAQIPRQIERAKAFIDAHFHGEADFSLAHLADISALSPNYLLEKFRKHLGKTPTQYLWDLRVHHGVNLLRKTGLPVGEVAYEAGFKCQHHFARTVKREFGVSPSQIRRDMWARQADDRK